MHNTNKRQDSAHWEATIYQLSVDESLLPKTFVPFHDIHYRTLL